MGWQAPHGEDDDDDNDSDVGASSGSSGIGATSRAIAIDRAAAATAAAAAAAALIGVAPGAAQGAAQGAATGGLATALPSPMHSPALHPSMNPRSSLPPVPSLPPSRAQSVLAGSRRDQGGSMSSSRATTPGITFGTTVTYSGGGPVGGSRPQGMRRPADNDSPILSGRQDGGRVPRSQEPRGGGGRRQANVPRSIRDRSMRSESLDRAEPQIIRAFIPFVPTPATEDQCALIYLPELIEYKYVDGATEGAYNPQDREHIIGRGHLFFLCNGHDNSAAERTNVSRLMALAMYDPEKPERWLPVPVPSTHFPNMDDLPLPVARPHHVYVIDNRYVGDFPKHLPHHGNMVAGIARHPIMTNLIDAVHPDYSMLQSVEPGAYCAHP
jgi:hypothetical protein